MGCRTDGRSETIIPPTTLLCGGYKSRLVQVMAWCHQATSHYLSQSWLTSIASPWIAWLSNVDVPFSLYCPHFMCPSMWKRQKLDNFMCLLEFECAKRLRALSQAISASLGDNGLITGIWNTCIPWEMGQYHQCWCPGSLHHKVISSHGTDTTV